MAEKPKSPPEEEAAPIAVDTLHGSGAIDDAETRPNATTAAERASGEGDEIEARPPPTMTPSQRLAVLVAQTRHRSAQAAAESGRHRTIQPATDDSKGILAPVVSPVPQDGGAAPAGPAAVPPSHEVGVPQVVEEAEPTEKDESPREQGLSEPFIDREPTAPGSGRGLRVGLAAVLAGGLAWGALAWIAPRFKETRPSQTAAPSVHTPSSSGSAGDLAPRKPSTPPTGDPSPASPETAVPAAPAARGPAEAAAEPGAHAPPIRAEEEDVSPEQPSPPPPASAKKKHDSTRAQPEPARSSNRRAARTRTKTKAAARSKSSSRKDPDDVLPLLTP